MEEFWLTFRIGDAAYGGKTGSQRYDALIDEIDSISELSWVEPTSFIMFRTNKNMGQVVQACKKAIAPPHDIVLIRMVNSRSARVLGKCDEFDTLKLFMDYAQKA